MESVKPKNAIIIKSFENGLFGHLTILKSQKTGKLMFIAKEVCDLWGHTNHRKAIKDAKLTSDEVLSLTKKQYPEFFNELCNQKLQSKNSPNIQLVTESGLYKLALKSKKKEADELKHWIANDVLPMVREKGKYVMPSATASIGDHRHVAIQKNNSRDVNTVNFKNGGIPEIVEYNTKSCVAVTGKKPKEIKQLGRQLGLKASECTSSKEVLRRIRPELACTMSFIDNGVKQGLDFDKYAELGKKYAAPLFKAMIESGMMPGELTM